MSLPFAQRLEVSFAARYTRHSGHTIFCRLTTTRGCTTAPSADFFKAPPFPTGLDVTVVAFKPDPGAVLMADPNPPGTGRGEDGPAMLASTLFSFAFFVVTADVSGSSSELSFAESEESNSESDCESGCVPSKFGFQAA
jgi:hypothetical protein